MGRIITDQKKFDDAVVQIKERTLSDYGSRLSDEDARKVALGERVQTRVRMPSMSARKDEAELTGIYTNMRGQKTQTLESQKAAGRILMPTMSLAQLGYDPEDKVDAEGVRSRGRTAGLQFDDQQVQDILGGGTASNLYTQSLARDEMDQEERFFTGYLHTRRDDQGNALINPETGEIDRVWVEGTADRYRLTRELEAILKREGFDHDKAMEVLKQAEREKYAQGWHYRDDFTGELKFVMPQQQFEAAKQANSAAYQAIIANGGMISYIDSQGRPRRMFIEGAEAFELKLQKMRDKLTRDGWKEDAVQAQEEWMRGERSKWGYYDENEKWINGEFWQGEQNIKLQDRLQSLREHREHLRSQIMENLRQKHQMEYQASDQVWRSVETQLDRQATDDLQNGRFEHEIEIANIAARNELIVAGLTGLAAIGGELLTPWLEQILGLVKGDGSIEWPKGGIVLPAATLALMSPRQRAAYEAFQAAMNEKYGDGTTTTTTTDNRGTASDPTLVEGGEQRVGRVNDYEYPWQTGVAAIEGWVTNEHGIAVGPRQEFRLADGTKVPLEGISGFNAAEMFGLSDAEGAGGQMFKDANGNVYFRPNPGSGIMLAEGVHYNSAGRLVRWSDGVGSGSAQMFDKATGTWATYGARQQAGDALANLDFTLRNVMSGIMGAIAGYSVGGSKIYGDLNGEQQLLAMGADVSAFASGNLPYLAAYMTAQTARFAYAYHSGGLTERARDFGFYAPQGEFTLRLAGGYDGSENQEIMQQLGDRDKVAARAEAFFNFNRMEVQWRSGHSGQGGITEDFADFIKRTGKIPISMRGKEEDFATGLSQESRDKMPENFTPTYAFADVRSGELHIYGVNGGRGQNRLVLTKEEAAKFWGDIAADAPAPSTSVADTNAASPAANQRGASQTGSQAIQAMRRQALDNSGLQEAQMDALLSGLDPQRQSALLVFLRLPNHTFTQFDIDRIWKRNGTVVASSSYDTAQRLFDTGALRRTERKQEEDLT